MQVLKTTFIILEVLLIFNLLIFVHELGHFLAARWRGLKVDRFAIWFGKPIWKKTINGVEYALGTIPAGGYVSLPQMAPMQIIEGKGESDSKPLPPISALDKIIVAVAGPLFSLLLAFTFAFVVWGIGRPEPRSKDSTRIGWVDANGPAWKAGLRPGDLIKSVDGHPVTQFIAQSQDSVTWRIVTSEGEDIPITYERDGKEATVRVVPVKLPTKWYERKSLRKILVAGAAPAVIAEVTTNSPAARAGLREGDIVTAVNGTNIFSPEAVMALQETFTNAPVASTTFSVDRKGSKLDVTITAEKPIKPADATPAFGIASWFVNTDEVLVHPAPIVQIQESAGQIFATLKTLFSRKSDVGVQQLGGAVMIIRAYKNLIDSENGWRRVLWFSVVLNVNLALLNMLPFPVLDGGHITLALIEAVRRRPVSAKVLEVVQTACAVVLIAFMLFIAFYDTGDWIRSAHRDREQPVEFAPKN